MKAWAWWTVVHATISRRWRPTCRSWAPRLELQESHEGRLDLGNVAAGGTGSEVGSRTVAAADTEAGRGIGSAGVAAEVVGAAEEVELVVLTINDC